MSYLARLAKMEMITARRIGIVLAVSGESGFALLAIILGADMLEQRYAQITLTAVQFSMIAAPILIRYNGVIAARAGFEIACRQRNAAHQQPWQ